MGGREEGESAACDTDPRPVRPLRNGVADAARWDWLAARVHRGPDPFDTRLDAADALEGAALWETLIRQRDKLSERASWLAENEGDRGGTAGALWHERAAMTTRSRLRFEELIEGLAAWAGVGVGDVAGLLAESEEADGPSSAGQFLSSFSC